jgi:hypothetical protein
MRWFFPFIALLSWGSSTTEATLRASAVRRLNDGADAFGDDSGGEGVLSAEGAPLLEPEVAPTDPTVPAPTDEPKKEDDPAPSDPPKEGDPPTEPPKEEDPPTNPPNEEDPPSEPPKEEDSPTDSPKDGDAPSDPPQDAAPVAAPTTPETPAPSVTKNDGGDAVTEAPTAGEGKGEDPATEAPTAGEGKGEEPATEAPTAGEGTNDGTQSPTTAPLTSAPTVPETKAPTALEQETPWPTAWGNIDSPTDNGNGDLWNKPVSGEIPTEKPVLYIPPDDDILVEEPVEPDWETPAETLEQMERDQNVLIALLSVFGFMLIFSIIVAHQMLNNPDGCCAR